MDAEDEFYDALEEVEDDFYDAWEEVEDDLYDETEEDEHSDGNYLDYAVVQTLQPKQEKYSILSEADIRRRLDEDIGTVSTVLSISRTWSSILMRHYNWSISEVNDAWFTDREKVCEKVGLLEKPIVEYSDTVKEASCEICFDVYSLNDMAAAVCGHLFCVSCWTGYISTAINDGQGCLMLCCPDPPCHAAIDQDFMDRFCSNEEKVKFSGYLVRSYVEKNRNIKWCPSPGCEYAVESEFDVSGNHDVTCDCSCSFCWNCAEDAHRPVDCETVNKWMEKHSSEAENTTWILAYTKPCPKCKKPIEKNRGCMHMQCRPPCSIRFCWLCLNSLSDHKSACNTFGPATRKDNEEEHTRKKAERYLERYNHYYERWASNEVSRQKALTDLQQMETSKLDKLRDTQGESSAQVEFIKEAWLQIVECRRVLKWTYAFGYYLPDYEHGNRQLFEYLQGEAESGLERLHYCAETELNVYFKAEERIPGFGDFRLKLVQFTQVTKNYFENLVQALENGLSDVNSNEGDTVPPSVPPANMRTTTKERAPETLRRSDFHLPQQLRPERAAPETLRMLDFHLRQLLHPGRGEFLFDYM